jgi:hypothetical protein
MTNNFNFEKDKYDIARRDCLDSLSDMYPDQTLPVLGWAVSESKRLSVGARLEAVRALTRAAALLSGHFDEEFFQDEITAAPHDARAISGGNAGGATATDSLDDQYAAVTAGMTVVRRPRRLAQMRQNEQRASQRTVYYRRNRLPDYVELLLEPLDGILTAATESDQVLLHLSPTTRTDNGDTTAHSDLPPASIDVEGIFVLVPAQALHALSVLVRSAANTLVHEELAGRALVAFSRFREAPALTLRRAAAATALSAVEAWRHCRLRCRGATMHHHARPTSALQALTNMTLLPGADRAGSAIGTAHLDSSVAAAVDWCVSQARSEPDPSLRALYSQVVAFALDVADAK